MIKKILLFILGIIFSANMVLAQCNPNPLLTENLMYPDTNTNLVRAYYGITYNEVIQINVPLDTLVSGTNAFIDSITIKNIENLPVGISWACNPSSKIIQGGHIGCILLSGVPILNVTELYNLKIRIRINGYVLYGGFPIQIPAIDTVLVGYKIMVKQVFTDSCGYTSTCANSNNFCPDGAANFKNAKVDSLYSQILQVIMTDTITSNGIIYSIDSAKIVLPVSGLPTPVNAQCSNSRCVFTPYSKGCLTFTGTPTIADTGIYHLNFVIRYYSADIASPGYIDVPINYYKIKIIKSNTGIEEMENYQFQLLQNTPNPSNYFTDIVFITPEPSSIQFKIVDVIGQVRYAREIKAKKGKTSIKIDSREFDSGIYFYSVSDGITTLSKTMIITK